MGIRLLALSGILAARVNRLANWVLVRPAALTIIAWVWAVTLVRQWPLLIVAPVALLFSWGRLDLQGNRTRRRRAQLGLPPPAPAGDVARGPLLFVAVVALYWIALPWPDLAVQVAAGLAVLALAGAILLGIRAGYVVFRPGVATNPRPITSAPPAAGPICDAFVSGIVMTHDMVTPAVVHGEETFRVTIVPAADVIEHRPIRVDGLPVRIASLPCERISAFGRPPRDAELAMMATSGPRAAAGLALSKPNVTAVEPGALIRPRKDMPALRLLTVTGPIFLSFRTDEERAAAERAIRDSLAIG